MAKKSDKDKNYVIRDRGGNNYAVDFLDPLNIIGYRPEEPVEPMLPPITEPVAPPSTPDSKIVTPPVKTTPVRPMGRVTTPTLPTEGETKPETEDALKDIIDKGTGGGKGDTTTDDAEMNDLIAQALIQIAPQIVGYLFQKDQGGYTGYLAGQKGMETYDKGKEAKKKKAEILRLEELKAEGKLDDYIYKKMLQDAKEGKDIDLKKLELDIKKKELGYKGKELTYKGKKLALEEQGKSPEQLEKKNKAERELRAEIAKDPLVKSAIAASQSYSKVMGGNPMTGAGQIAIITSYMKLLDEGSVVRETEFAQAAKAGGEFSRLQNLVDSITKGLSVHPDTIRDIQNQAKAYYKIQKDVLEPTYNYWRTIGQKQGLDLDSLYIDPTTLYEQAIPKYGESTDKGPKRTAAPLPPEVNGEVITKQKVFQTKDVGKLNEIIEGLENKIKKLGQ